ncbi:MAG: peroxidase [Planctomycetota bacterium]|nr:peroxidase [Planctomycetota bacterium]
MKAEIPPAASPRLSSLLGYAYKLTKTPGDMTEADLEPLRNAGVDDAEISHSAQVISYFNYINRIADGLGVDLETWMPQPT